ncbi:MAG: leucyl aminopeptidase [Nitrospirae bacterium]|nr:MAG: leucyl aminopeptidase [Nitrospirota bacterium]
MKMTVTQQRLQDEAADAILLSHWESEDKFSGETAAIDAALKGRLRELLKNGEFSGRLGQVSILHVAPGERVRAKRVVLMGLGKRKEGSLEKVRRAVGTAVKAIREAGAKSFATPVHGRALPESGRATGAAAQATVEGALLGLYQFNAYRTDQNNHIKAVKTMTVVADGAESLAEIQQGASAGQIISDAVTFVRDLCNHPANVMTPTYVEHEAKKIARERGISCKVLNRPDMQRLGMGALLGVSLGSHQPPKFIILEYRGGSAHERPVALVGKTVTFDSGGISLKPADNMEQMKADMTGGAAVLAAVGAAARLRLPLNVIGIIPATENMPGGSATKPGDILKSLSGKTIEVINTDAEGRLILADGLTYATRYHPDVLVDIATLTGACVVALGTHAIGVLGNNAALIEELQAAGEQCGERTWQLPLWEEYYEQIKSDVADMKNTGGRPGGTITAAAFLSKFVGESVWAHLDIASTDWSDRERGHIPKGPTGVGARLLIQFLRNRANGASAGARANGKKTSRRAAAKRSNGRRP